MTVPPSSPDPRALDDLVARLASLETLAAELSHQLSDVRGAMVSLREGSTGASPEEGQEPSPAPELDEATLALLAAPAYVPKRTREETIALKLARRAVRDSSAA